MYLFSDLLKPYNVTLLNISSTLIKKRNIVFLSLYSWVTLLLYPIGLWFDVKQLRFKLLFGKLEFYWNFVSNYNIIIRDARHSSLYMLHTYMYCQCWVHAWINNYDPLVSIFCVSSLCRFCTMVWRICLPLSKYFDTYVLTFVCKTGVATVCLLCWNSKYIHTRTYIHAYTDGIYTSVSPVNFHT